jgi:Zn-dependent alcohol dehydrogenase
MRAATLAPIRANARTSGGASAAAPAAAKPAAAAHFLGDILEREADARFDALARHAENDDYNNKAILGCRYGAARPRTDFPMLADLYLTGRLKIDELITRHYALDQVAGAIDDLKSGALARGVFRV